jgi:hypothetical protein
MAVYYCIPHEDGLRIETCIDEEEKEDFLVDGIIVNQSNAN